MTPAEFTEARRKLGLPAADLAPLIGVSPARAVQTFSDWATGRRQIDAAKALLLRAYLDGYRPADWPVTDTKEGKGG